MPSLTPTYDRIVKKIGKFRKREKSLSLYLGLVHFLFFNTSIAFILLVCEGLFSFSSQVRTALIVLYVLVLLITLSKWVIPALYALFFRPHQPPLDQIALKIGKSYKKVDDRLANALQIFEKHHKNPENYSILLVDASLSNVAEILDNENFNQKIDYFPLFKSIKKLLLFCSVLVVMWVVAGSFFNIAMIRMVYPRHDFSIDSNLVVKVWPGNKTILKGENVDFRIWISDATQENVELNLKKYTLSQKVTLNRTKDDTFRYTVANVKDSLDYFVSVNKYKSPLFNVSVLERPILRTLQLKIIPPAYSKLEPFLLDQNVGDVSSLKGSFVNITGEANKPIESGQIIFASGKNNALKVSDRKITAAFDLLQDDKYWFHIRDKFGYQSENPIEYHLNVIPDQSPFIRIISPGKDIDLGEDMRIPLILEAQDDFGVSKLRLGYHVLPDGSGETDSLDFSYQELKEIDTGKEHLNVAFDWDVSNLDMLPTDVLVYFAEVFDNDNVSGPKSTKSKIYKARFPSIYELYDEISKSQDETYEIAENVHQQAEELKKKIDDLSLEVQRNTEMDWQQKQEVENALMQQQELRKELENMSKKFDDIIEKMEKNELISAETMEKYQELQKLFQDIMTPELKEAMQKISEAIQKMDQKKIQQAMEELKFSEEEMEKSIERTMSLLKKLKMEQKLDQTIKMTEDLLERQEKLQKESKTKNPAELTKEQDQIKKDSQDLNKTLNDLQKEMSEMAGMPQEEVNQAKAELDSAVTSKNMEQLKELLQSGDQSGFQQKSQQVQTSLKDVSQKLQQAKDVMTGAENRRTMNALKQSSRELLELSKRQESLMKETEQLTSNSAYSPEIADQQKNVSSALKRVIDKMYETSKQSFFMNPKMSKSMGEALEEMEKSIKSLQDRNNSNASKAQGEAMASLNESIKQIQASMQNMMQGNNPGMSYEQYLQQMQQMANQQQGINEQTMAMGLGQQMKMQEQAGLSRLASNQGQVRKSMQELAQEAGEMSDILGDLDNIVEDMKSVEKDIANQKITSDTIQRQNKILSRMLDAQKSLHEREYSKKRQAETGKDYKRTSPDELPSHLGERLDRLQQDLLRAKKEGFSRDYLELVKKYFESITEYEDERARKQN